MHHRLAWLVLLLIACTACTTSSGVSPTATSTRAPAGLTAVSARPATPAPVGTWEYESPSGRFHGSAVCYQGHMMWDCYTPLPNGPRLHGVPANWSPDERYFVVGYGATHDSNPSTYAVWDMLNRAEVYAFNFNRFAWSPQDPHTLVHIAGHEIAIEYDAEIGQKRELTQCPAWFQTKYPKDCEDWGGVIIGGRLDGLLDGIAGLMHISTGSPVMLGGNGSWRWTLKPSKGPTYFCPKFPRYDAYPQCYLVQAVGDQAYVVENGQVTTTRADHLDFRFEEWRP